VGERWTDGARRIIRSRRRKRRRRRERINKLGFWTIG